MSDYGSFDDTELPLFSAVNRLCVVEKQQEPFGSDYSKKKLEIANALKLADLSCVEVETRWHRGQAVVKSLRQDGHLIDTVRGIYRYRGFNRDMVRVSKSISEMYYTTPHWRNMAKLRKEHDGKKCVQCNSTEKLETHHWRYDLFEEELSDLTTLCKICHEWIHECVKGSSVHFPRSLPQSIIDRIMADGISDS